MRGALLYSGYIRALPIIIKNHLDCFLSVADNLDLYFSLWDCPGYVDHLNAPDFLVSEREFDQNQIITSNLVEECISYSNNVSIKAIKIEKYDPKQYSMDLLNGASDKLAAQFYKITDCYDLLDPTVGYDFVVRMRCDIRFERMIGRQNLIDTIGSNRIIFTEKIWYDHPRKPGMNDINDMLWIGNKELCRKACNVYNNVEKINAIIEQRGQTQNNFGENICCMNLVAEGIEDLVELFDFDFRILR